MAAPDKYVNQTLGLLGVFNKDPSDDLTPANGSPPLNITTATEKMIFHEFGETCELQLKCLSVKRVIFKLCVSR